jgi:DNA-binding NarL/FixJ family response regulator
VSRWPLHNPETLPDAEIDEVAVQRALHGDPVRLNRFERRAAVEVLTKRGLSARKIAERLRVTERAVQRHRTAIRRAA